MTHTVATRSLQDQYIWSDIILSQAKTPKFYFYFLSVGLFIILIKTIHDE